MSLVDITVVECGVWSVLVALLTLQVTTTMTHFLRTTSILNTFIYE